MLLLIIFDILVLFDIILDIGETDVAVEEVDVDVDVEVVDILLFVTLLFI